ncbi:hypothetical protein K0M31_017662 [Melipona bicolor]|uniref:Uncharacterized protein n=1 Tax=Melipona bicolor TaxID=60889 RepID=A0AA40G5A3_9HYME|nr:hypothetical protein K0M31_017662 [Melipona bicolor]
MASCETATGDQSVVAELFWQRAKSFCDSSRLAAAAAAAAAAVAAWWSTHNVRQQEANASVASVGCELAWIQPLLLCRHLLYLRASQGCNDPPRDSGVQSLRHETVVRSLGRVKKPVGHVGSVVEDMPVVPALPRSPFYLTTLCTVRPEHAAD